MGDNIYFHKDYIELFDFAERIKEFITYLPKNYDFNIIRFNLKNKDASFMFSPDFDTSFYPIVKTSLKINSDKTLQKVRDYGENAPIYHYRWVLVKDDYLKCENGEKKNGLKKILGFASYGVKFPT